MKNRFFTLSCLLLLTLSVFSRDYDWRIVYLWDVTYSMHGGYFAPKVNKQDVIVGGKNVTIDGYDKKHDIYDNILGALVKDIESLNPRTQVVIIPFGAKVLDVWTEMATDNGKKILLNNLKTFCNISPVDVQSTSISGALEYVRDKIFTAEVPNTLKLLTDGVENVNKQKFYNLLDSWCLYAEERNVEGYYFVLSDEVLKSDFALKERLERNCFSVIENITTELPIVKSDLHLQSEVNVVVKDSYNKSIQISVSLNGNLESNIVLHFMTEDNTYVFIDEKIEIGNDTHSVKIPIHMKTSLIELCRMLPTDSSEIITLHVSVEKGTEQVALRTTDIKINMINQVLKTMNITVR